MFHTTQKIQNWFTRKILHNLGEYYLRYNYTTGNYEPNISLARYIILRFQMWRGERANQRFLKRCWVEDCGCRHNKEKQQ